MNSITLIRGPQCWLAQFSDPAVVKLFGGDTIPTAYKAGVHAAVVMRAIAQLNPDATVEVRNDN